MYLLSVYSYVQGSRERENEGMLPASWKKLISDASKSIDEDIGEFR